MGFRFRRSIRLGKGLRINVSKSGASLSVGRPGATINFGPNGRKATIGLPGTGLSYSKKIGNSERSERRSQGDDDAITPPAVPSNPPSQKVGLRPWLALLAIILVIIAAVFAQQN